MSELTPQEKSKVRAALLRAGQATRGLSDDNMVAAYEKHIKEQGETPAPDRAPVPKAERARKAQPQPEEKEKQPMTQAVAPQADMSALAQQFAAMFASMQQPAPAIDEPKLIALIKEHASMTLNVEAPDREPVTIKGAHRQLEEVVTWASTGTNVYLTGPAGSGKTTLAQQTAEALGLKFYSTGAIMASYELLGVRTAHGDYIPTGLRTAYENGGVFLLDEVDACSAKALVCFNQLLANDSFTFPDGMVKKHPDFVAIAGANTTGQGATRQYIGRSQLDAATLDRFIQIEVEYDTALEKRLAQAEYKAHGGTDEQALEHWVNKVQALRGKLLEMKSTALVTPRASMFGARGLAKGLSMDVLVKQVLTKHLTEDQKNQLGRV